jgi:integrase
VPVVYSVGILAVVTLTIAQPWKDPKTGIFKLRRRVPKRYVPVAGDRLIKHSLHTHDPAEARRKWPLALEWWDQQVAAWECQLSVVDLDEAGAEALIEKWREWVLFSPDANRGEFGRNLIPADGAPAYPPQDLLDRHVDKALRMAGIAITDSARIILEREMVKAILAEAVWQDQRGSGLVEVVRMKGIRPLPHQPESDMLTVDRLLDDWKAVATVKPRTIAETVYAVDALVAAVAHRDARRVTRDDVRRWRDSMKAAGAVNNTWNNRLSMVGRVFALAVDAGKLSTNPADTTLRLTKSRVASWEPYSDEDAAKILVAARKEERASRRWAHWVMAFSGMRIAEVLQLTAGDVRRDRDTGIWFIAVNDDEPGKSVKNGQRRHVPIHNALAAEGFLDFARTVTGNAPLFPDKRADTNGSRGGRGWQVVGRWVRDTVGITDSRKAPDHSWRHRMEDELRAAECPEDVRDAILGHARKTVGMSYGIRGESLRRLHGFIEKVHNPMAEPVAAVIE